MAWPSWAHLKSSAHNPLEHCWVKLFAISRAPPGKAMWLPMSPSLSASLFLRHYKSPWALSPWIFHGSLVSCSKLDISIKETPWVESEASLQTPFRKSFCRVGNCLWKIIFQSTPRPSSCSHMLKITLHTLKGPKRFEGLSFFFSHNSKNS